MNWLRDLLGRVWTGWGGQNSPRSIWSGGGWLGGYLPGSTIDYEAEAGAPWLNGTAAACLGWLCDELPQSRFVVQEAAADHTLVPRWDHRLTKLLDRPNPFWTGEQLWQALLVDFLVYGNAYLITYLSRAGDVVELWRVDPEQIEPQWSEDGSDWISHYRYQPMGTPYRVPVDRVVHFRDRPDPSNPRKGIGRIQSVLRELCADNEASTYTYALLKNLGQAGAVISPDDAGLEPEQAESVVRQIQQQTTGDRRFRPLASSVPLRTSRLGDSPESMKLDVIPKHVEARICAAISVNPMVLALPCAKDFATYANAEQAAKATWSRLMAIQRNLAATVRTQLLPRVDPNPRLTCGWDWTDVAALQANALDLAKRAAMLSAAKIIRRKEARELVGYEPIGDPILDDAFIDKGSPLAPPPNQLDESNSERAGGPARRTFRHDDPHWVY